MKKKNWKPAFDKMIDQINSIEANLTKYANDSSDTAFSNFFETIPVGLSTKLQNSIDNLRSHICVEYVNILKENKKTGN